MKTIFLLKILVLTLVTLSACERVPEWERKAAKIKSLDTQVRLSEFKRFLWTCRALSLRSSEAGAKQALNLGDHYEAYLDFFRAKDLSTIDTAGPKMILGSAFLWDAQGTLVASIPDLANLKGVECRNRDQNWTAAKIVGQDEGLDLTVLKVEYTGAKFKTNPWLTREDAPRLDDEVWAVSSLLPGQLDRQQVTLEGLSPDLQSGLDSDLMLFLPPPALVVSTGILVDQEFRLLGMLLVSLRNFWGTAVSRARVERSILGILKNGKIDRPYLGVKLQAAHPHEGLMVTQVAVGSPAYQAGLRTQDVLIEWNGVKILSEQDWKEPAVEDVGRMIRFKFKRGSSVTESSVSISTQD